MPSALEISPPPEIPEPVRHQSGVDSCARNRQVPELSLDRSRVVPLVGERIATGMAKHVRVNLQFKAKTPACCVLDHPGKARGRATSQPRQQRPQRSTPGQAHRA